MKKLKRKTNQLIKKSIVLIVLVSIGFLTSCDPRDALKLDEGKCEKEWNKMVENEVAAYNDALTAYGQDPTTENCNEVKKTGNAYVDALEDVEKCVKATNKKDWENVLESMREYLKNLNCE